MPVLLRRFALLLAFPVVASAASLQIYVIDVEGRGATLIISPSGESMLVDTGNGPPNAERDSGTIRKAMEDAGLKKIDYLFTTHYDGDHVGGVQAADQFAHFSRFFDHGDMSTAFEQNPGIEQRWKIYTTVSAGKRTPVNPGDMIPLKGVKVEVVAAHGNVITKPVNGGGPNRYCDGAEQKAPDKTENSRSAGFLLTYGKFTSLRLGDLTWDKEMALACPVNQLGRVSLFVATHHGFYSGMSGAPAYIWGVQPEVVIANNGPRKSLPAEAYERIQKVEGIQGLWQLHLNLLTDVAHNTKEDMIANMEASDKCQGNWVKVTVESDGKFVVSNHRNGFAQTYEPR
jgi:competence protein ComEC